MLCWNLRIVVAVVSAKHSPSQDFAFCLLKISAKNKEIIYASVNSNCALPLPPGNCGAFARLVSPGDGALANLARPGGRAFANHGDNPEKFVDVFKGMFS